jgi:hypothetical protein
MKFLRRKSDMTAALEHIRQRLDELAATFNDREIAERWVKLAKAEPQATITTAKGLQLSVHRTPGFNKVSYTAFPSRTGLPGLLARKQERVAWMHCMAPLYGRVQVTNANVYELAGTDYRRQGIGTAIYDLIERDVRAAGGSGLEPHWGSMSDEAIAFWKKRRPDEAHAIEQLNRLGPGLASGLFD